MAGKVVDQSLVLLSKFGASRQKSAPKTATSHIRRTLSATLTDHRADINRPTKTRQHTDRHFRHDSRHFCIFIFPTARKKMKFYPTPLAHLQTAPSPPTKEPIPTQLLATF